MNKIKITILVALIVFTILFIFSNSAKGSSASSHQSSQVVNTIIKIFRLEGKIDTSGFHSFIRKAAHFTEFFLLGGQLMLLKYEIDKKYFNKLTALPFILALIIALSDEFIQSFSDRVSSLGDVLLDFTGAIFGIFTAILLIIVVKRIIFLISKKHNINAQ